MATERDYPPIPIGYDPAAGIDYGIQYDPAAGPATMPIPYDAPAGMVAPPMGPQFGTGPSIGSSGGYNPETGERYTTQFRYTPVDPQQDMMRQAFERQQQAFYPPPPQPQGPTPYWEDPETYYPRQQRGPDPIEQAKASTAAAYKYIAMRGYQSDLKEGKSAAESFAKWGPMLVQDTSLAPAMKAFQPQPKPVWIPGNPATGQPGAFSGGKVQFPPSNKPPTSIQEVDEIQKTELAMRKALASGNQELAKSLQERAALLRDQLKGQETSVGYDDQGRLQVRIGKGGTPTVATQSQAQQKLIKYEGTMELMARLEDVLKPEHVGVRGVGGEWIVDKGLQQIAEISGGPDVGSEGRMESRKLMVALREGLMREISGDPRFSNVDREEITKALPSNGVFESYMDAKKSMDTVKKIIVQRSKNYAKAVGSEPPLWTLTPEEIKASYKSGKMTLDDAKNALTRFH